MHAYVDVDMQMSTFMRMDAYACICMHIPLAGGAHPGGPYPWGGGTVKLGTEDIYIFRKSLMGAGRKGSGPNKHKNLVFDVPGLPFRGLECLDGCSVFFNMYCDVQLVAL